MFELNNFDAMQIALAGPEKIREWSHGEVTKSETINYRTQKPERDGLFCERIFGPTKDWECHCGKYKRVRYKGVICDKCGVEVTRSKVRRERMGHIELAAPVTHIWYFKGVPSRIATMLEMSPKALEQIVYFVSFVVLDPKDTELEYKQILTQNQFEEYRDKYGENGFKAGMGAEAIKELLGAIDVKSELEKYRKIVAESTGQKKLKAIKRLEVLDAFAKSGNDPTWMVLDVIPVLPPEIRPMVPLDGGRYACSDLNDLYRKVITRNNRLKKLIESNSPEIIIRNEKRMLQEAVDALIDNGRRGKPVTGPGGRPLKSLSEYLKGKAGRFRQNLLGKRVDYSGRSVIVVGPELKMYQCGLPKEMALELFKPFIMHELMAENKVNNAKSAKRYVERAGKEVWGILERVIKEHPVLLNRAPTLHRLGIQAFEPVLVEGRAIKLHPLACGAFNADFDGDQMAVHVPLSIEAQTEARFLMLATNNVLKLSDGKPVCSPSQDMVIGSFYLTMDKPGAKGEGMIFCDTDEAKMAYANHEIELQSKIKVRFSGELNGQKITKIIETTLGRILFNEYIPQDLGQVDRTNPETFLNLEIDYRVGKGQLKKIVDWTFKKHGATVTCTVLDAIKSQGFKYSTIGAITTSVFDMTIPEEKHEIISKAEEEALKYERSYENGEISAEAKHKFIVDTWSQANEKLSKAVQATLDEFNPIKMMAVSGARGSDKQIAQLSGMRGLMTNPQGDTLETPVKASFREGLSPLDYFISSHGGRKGLADTALKTANSGYLTRRLVDVSQDVIVREEDCCSNGGVIPGIYVDRIMEGVDVIDDLKTIYEKLNVTKKAKVVESLKDRLAGRFAAEDVVDPTTGEVIIKANEMFTEDLAAKVDKIDMQLMAEGKRISSLNAKGTYENGVKIRSVLTCKCKHGVCSKCYGKDMSSSVPVRVGEAVGIIAAQSIGEPGTQLTMRTFHSGGVAAAGDITQGLPRVEELFEARRPKGVATITKEAGVVKYVEQGGRRDVIIKTGDKDVTYSIPFAAHLKSNIVDGAVVKAGDPLTEGPIDPHDILGTKGYKDVQEYIVNQVQSVYRSQDVEIADKHIEVIVHQMLKKVRVEDGGDTPFLPGEMVESSAFAEANQKAMMEGGRPAIAKHTLLGITKAALATDSFLSAASFQETARVLTEAAIKNKVDPLIGLKENVIIGKLIPAGTGMKNYKNFYPAETELMRSSFDDLNADED